MDSPLHMGAFNLRGTFRPQKSKSWEWINRRFSLMDHNRAVWGCIAPSHKIVLAFKWQNITQVDLRRRISMQDVQIWDITIGIIMLDGPLANILQIYNKNQKIYCARENIERVLGGNNHQKLIEQMRRWQTHYYYN